MVKLLVLADDLTGALDTGAQFASVGVHTVIAIHDNISQDIIKKGVKVLVVDLQTRHRNVEDAYEIVYKIVKRAIGMGIRYIYKKTDSALRGNIGSEIEAALLASGEKYISFVPAFPKMNRITVDGVHWIDGVPVNESVFGSDPFEPVKYARVKTIIGMQSNVPVWEMKNGGILDDSKEQPGIIVYDASTDEQLEWIAQTLYRKGRMRVTAGCAGFAAYLPQILHLVQEPDFCRIQAEKMLVLSGSLNPISIKQVCAAQEYGFGRVTLKKKQKLDRNYWETAEGKAELEMIWLKAAGYKGFIIDSGNREDMLDEEERRFDVMEGEGISSRVAKVMGGLLKFLLDKGMKSALFIIGGDTLRGIMECLQVREIEPMCELETGVIYSRFLYRGKQYDLITKSGGFGEEGVIPKIFQCIVDGEEWKDGIE